MRARPRWSGGHPVQDPQPSVPWRLCENPLFLPSAGQYGLLPITERHWMGAHLALTAAGINAAGEHDSVTHRGMTNSDCQRSHLRAKAGEKEQASIPILPPVGPLRSQRLREHIPHPRSSAFIRGPNVLATDERGYTRIGSSRMSSACPHFGRTGCLARRSASRATLLAFIGACGVFHRCLGSAAISVTR